MYDAEFYSNFGDPYINPLWKWQNEDPEGWYVGYNPQTTYYGLNVETQPSPIKNILSMEAPEGYYNAMLELAFIPSADGQFAGMRIYQDADNYVQIGMDRENGATRLVWKARKNGVDQQASLPHSQYRAQLRLTRQGTTYIGEIMELYGTWKALGYAAFSNSLPQIQLLTGGGAPVDPAISATFLNYYLFYNVPRLAYHTSTSFLKTELPANWSWLNEDRSGWSIGMENGLTIQAPQTEGHTNVLLHALPEGDFDLRVRLNFSPDANVQKAGVIIYAGEEDYLSLSKGFCNFVQDCQGVGEGVFFEQVRGGQPTGERFPTRPVFGYNYNMLRIVRQGDTYSAYTTANNTVTTWDLIGRHKMDSGFAPTHVGLKTNSYFQAPSIPASFWLFQMDSAARDGYAVFLPVLFKSGGGNSPVEPTPKPTEWPTPEAELTLTPTVEEPPPGW